ncbi:hypothetical protein ACGF5M_03890 [Gemmatimonadota bacterium]
MTRESDGSELVPSEWWELTESESLEGLFAPLKKRQVAFLEAWLDLKKVNAAAEATGIPASTHRYWRSASLEYAAAAEAVRECVNAWWDGFLADRAVNGHEEVKRDKDGNVVETRQKQDSSYTRMLMGGMQPEKYGRSEKTDQVINVQIVNRVEGRRYRVEGNGEGTPKDIPLIEAEAVEEEDGE